MWGKKRKESQSQALIIDKDLTGDIKAENIIVKENTAIKGNIRGQSVRVEGRVKGDILALKRVEIYPGGVVIGKISTPKLIMAEDAIHKGQIST